MPDTKVAKHIIYSQHTSLFPTSMFVVLSASGRLTYATVSPEVSCETKFGKFIFVRSSGLKFAA